MAVAQLVHLFESLDQQSHQQGRRGHHRRSSARLRLALQSVLHHPTASQASNSSSTTPSSSQRSSPSPSWRSTHRRLYAHSADLSSLFSSRASSPCTRTRYMRRRPSMTDLALEAERSAVGAENLGLRLLEPRPQALSFPQLSNPYPLSDFMNESRPAPVVLDGIFEVMESG